MRAAPTGWSRVLNTHEGSLHNPLKRAVKPGSRSCCMSVRTGKGTCLCFENNPSERKMSQTLKVVWISCVRGRNSGLFSRRARRRRGTYGGSFVETKVPADHWGGRVEHKEELISPFKSSQPIYINLLQGQGCHQRVALPLRRTEAA